MRIWPVMVVLPILAGCAATPIPTSTPLPMPTDIGWTAATVAPVPSDPLPRQASRRPMPSEKVFPYEPGRVDVVQVQVNHPLMVSLQPDEALDFRLAGDRTTLPEHDQTPPWDVVEGRSHVLVVAARPGLSMGLTMKTNQNRVYQLDLHSVERTKVRSVRWDYGAETVTRERVPRRLPHLTHPQQYHAGYVLRGSTPPPTWTPSQVLDDGQQTYILLPVNVSVMETPMARLIGTQGYEMVNTMLVGHVLVVPHLFNALELRIGNTPQAEVVRIDRGPAQVVSCPGDARCPLWPVL